MFVVWRFRNRTYYAHDDNGLIRWRFKPAEATKFDVGAALRLRRRFLSGDLYVERP